MLEVITEPFAFEFMRHALYAGLLTVGAASLVGTWVVLRGMAFMGDAMAHGVLPGIAIAFLLGGNLIVGAAISAAVMIGGVSLASARSRLGEDTAIGLLFVGMLAAGVAIISARGAYAGELTTILFGDPIGVTGTDLRNIAVVFAATILVSLVCYRPFLVLTFSRAKARVLGLRPGVAHLLMLALIAAVVISSFRTVGTLLVFAFIVAPPATAALIARRVPVMMVVSMLIGAVMVFVGLLLSFHFATATAATIAGLSVVTFFAVLASTELVALVRRIAARRHGGGWSRDPDAQVHSAQVPTSSSRWESTR